MRCIFPYTLNRDNVKAFEAGGKDGADLSKSRLIITVCCFLAQFGRAVYVCVIGSKEKCMYSPRHFCAQVFAMILISATGFYLLEPGEICGAPKMGLFKMLPTCYPRVG